MALVAVTSGSQATTIGTEHSLTQQAGVGIYVLLVDTSAMAVGDALTVRIKTKLASGSSSLAAYTYTFTDAQSAPNKYSVPVPVDVEIICTLTQTAGTACAFPWKLLRA